VLPSRLEGFPLSILEAMMAGRPVLATDVGSIREAVADGTTGLVVPAGDTDSLRRSLERLAADPDERRRMGEAGRARAVELFTADRMARSFEQLYGGVLGEEDRFRPRADLLQPVRRHGAAAPRSTSKTRHDLSVGTTTSWWFTRLVCNSGRAQASRGSQAFRTTPPAPVAHSGRMLWHARDSGRLSVHRALRRGLAQAQAGRRVVARAAGTLGGGVHRDRGTFGPSTTCTRARDLNLLCARTSMTRNGRILRRELPRLSRPETDFAAARQAAASTASDRRLGLHHRACTCRRGIIGPIAQ
jgi:hypothetical protein